MDQSGRTGDAPPRPPQATCLVVILVCVGAFCLLIAFTLVASFISLPILVDSAVEELQQHPAIGQKLPHLELAPLIGADEVVKLDDLEGKVVVVNFWGTWCPPCRVELPHLAELEKRFENDPDFMLLAVSCGMGGLEDAETLFRDTRTFLEEEEIEIASYADPNETVRQAFNSIGGFRGYPTTFVMDRQGVIRAVWVGFAPEIPEQLDRLVAELLTEDE